MNIFASRVFNSKSTPKNKLNNRDLLSVQRLESHSKAVIENRKRVERGLCNVSALSFFISTANNSILKNKNDSNVGSSIIHFIGKEKFIGIEKPKAK